MREKAGCRSRNGLPDVKTEDEIMNQTGNIDKAHGTAVLRTFACTPYFV